MTHLYHKRNKQRKTVGGERKTTKIRMPTKGNPTDRFSSKMTGADGERGIRILLATTGAATLTITVDMGHHTTMTIIIHMMKLTIADEAIALVAAAGGEEIGEQTIAMTTITADAKDQDAAGRLLLEEEV